MPTKKNIEAPSKILQNPLTENGENADLSLYNNSKTYLHTQEKINVTKENIRAQESLSLDLANNINTDKKNTNLEKEITSDINHSLDLQLQLDTNKNATLTLDEKSNKVNIKSLDSKINEESPKHSLESSQDIGVILALNELQQKYPIVTAQINKQQMHKATMNNKLISSLSKPVFAPNNTKKQTKSQQDLNPKNQSKIIKITKNTRKNRFVKKPFFSSITWFVVIIAIMIAGYKTLRDGISIESLSFGDIHIKQVFLQLNEKLTLEIDNIDISALESQPKKDEDQDIVDTVKHSAEYIQKTLYALSYFERLKIKNLILSNNKHISLYYDSVSYKLDTPTFHANLSIKDNQNSIKITINEFLLKNFPIQINGKITYMIPKNEMEFNFGMILESKQILNANGKTNFHKIDLNASSIKLKNLDLIKPYIDGLDNMALRKTLQDWLYDKIEYDSLQLTRLQTSININNITKSLLDNTKANITIKNAAVTLNPGVQPIYSPQVEIQFSRANLKIIPMYATFANMNLHGSEVLISNIPSSNIYIFLNGKDVRLDSHLNKLLQSYDVFVPVMQESIKSKQKQNEFKNRDLSTIAIEQTMQDTELIVTQAIDNDSKNIESIDTGSIFTQNANMDKKQAEQNEQANTDVSSLYDKMLELNSNTTLKSKSSINAQDDNNSSLHLKIAIEVDKKDANKHLFSLQGAVQAKLANLSLFDIPLEAKQINVALDITPNDSFIYINGTRVRWKGIFNADANIILDLNKKTLKASTHIHEARLNSKNIYILSNEPKKMALQDQNLENQDMDLISQNLKNKNANNGIYLNNTSEIIQQSSLQKKLKQYGYSINKASTMQNQQIAPNPNQTNNIYKSLAQNTALDKNGNQNTNKIESQNINPVDSIPNIENISSDISKQDNSAAKNDEYVLKELKNNPVWDKLKIRTKKTREFNKLSQKELEDLALKQIKIDEEGLNLEHDFIRINNTNINLSLSFKDDLILNIPALSLSLRQGSKNLNIKVDSLDKILKFSPLARYYGLEHGSFNLNVPYYDSNLKENKNNENADIHNKQNISKDVKAKAAQNNQDKDTSKNSNNKQNVQSTQTLTQSGTSTHIVLSNQDEIYNKNHNSQDPKNEKSNNQESNGKISNQYNNKQSQKNIEQNKQPFNAEFILNLTQLKYPIYTISHQKITFLTLKGEIKNGALTITANPNLDFKSQDSLSMLRIKGYRINVDEMYESKIPFFVELLKDSKKEDLPYSEAEIKQELALIAIKNKLRKKMKINAADFNVLGENLQLTFLGYTAPFDSITVRSVDDRIVIDGQYGKGILNVNVIKDNISIKAKNFSGDFLNTVLTSTKDGKKILEGGIFSVDLLYRGQILNGSAEIQNTSLTNFKAVQNIFALIDTVPSLFIFKNPHITTKGYQVSYGKILFAMNEDYIGLQNIFLIGGSMDINGWGIIDKDSQEMNMNLNISTIKNLSKFINKIPIIGYLILGREGQINTNLILTGKYSDPNIHITLAADIIKAPFNILRRIFTPVDLNTNRMSNDEAIY
ncbi:hypothetical protein LS73_008880 [Helicobacter muridarum]|uniref:Periplasmic protein n=1 Tax=Helicobacter muridarum TaxID=216 RepID=A0A099U015_9HELI|nr:AsmA-like C-terminal domain-containing protein [Helicobacter muridarum]TLD98478.1 hypothetical protein LS73_008880 [Helicobacter muridarum]STQ85578.1 Putative periplasmic protein [Helicobacter muridarum]